MFAYWFLFLVPMILSLPLSASRRKPNAFLLVGVFAVFLILVGLRDKVGMDWNNYLHGYYADIYNTFGDALQGYEPGFALLKWLMVRLGWGIYGVNFFSALVFNVGLFSYAGKCANPWLAIAAVTPFLVIAVAMSGTRQAMAIGVFFFVLAHWERIGAPGKLALLLLASSLHASAIALTALVVYDLKLHLAARHPLLITCVRYVLLAGTVLLAVIYLPQTEGFKNYEEDYYLGRIDAPGALQHMSLNMLPAIFFFAFRDRFREIVGASRVFEAICFLCIVSLPAISVSSSAVDRFSLYFSVVQMTVISALPSIAGFRARRTLILVGLLVYLSLILLIWLNFSNSARAYIPYGNVVIRLLFP